jgi:hypothetical protein
MANILGQQPPKQKVDISNSVPMLCPHCEYDVFISGTKFRKLSKLAFGGEQDMIIPFEVLVCGECGEVNNEMSALELQALEHKDKLSKEQNG